MHKDEVKLATRAIGRWTTEDTVNTAGEMEVLGGGGKRRKRGRRPAWQGIGEGEVSRHPAPACGLATEAAACSRLRRRRNRLAAAASRLL